MPKGQLNPRTPQDFLLACVAQTARYYGKRMRSATVADLLLRHFGESWEDKNPHEILSDDAFIERLRNYKPKVQASKKNAGEREIKKQQVVAFLQQLGDSVEWSEFPHVQKALERAYSFNPRNPTQEAHEQTEMWRQVVEAHKAAKKKIAR